MNIDTEKGAPTLEKLQKMKTNSEKGIVSFEKEIEEINKFLEKEIVEAKRIELLLENLKKSRKLESKQKALLNSQERLNAINDYLNNKEVK